jgi:hypothetical protein
VDRVGTAGTPRRNPAVEAEILSTSEWQWPQAGAVALCLHAVAGGVFHRLRFGALRVEISLIHGRNQIESQRGETPPREAALCEPGRGGPHVADKAGGLWKILAAEFGFRMIRTPNGGLSRARNLGAEAATGEFVAYIDDDAYPDPHWLHHLAARLESGDWVGVGGPNLTPLDDGLIAKCVANSPGGPGHVLISDREAEHVPGCNMAFRKSALEAVGGFDEQFRVVGDDVDLCWRVLERGWKIGLSPAAVVWHHRRNSVLMYWKQQYGYGRAEALLQHKWPEKYNMLGHSAGSGRVYGKGQMPFLGVVSRIYKSHERHCHT